jgi:hypothetical protein
MNNGDIGYSINWKRAAGVKGSFNLEQFKISKSPEGQCSQNRRLKIFENKGRQDDTPEDEAVASCCFC